MAAFVVELTAAADPDEISRACSTFASTTGWCH